MFARSRIVLAALCAAVLALALSAGLAKADTTTDTGVILNDQGVLVPGGYDSQVLAVSRVEPDSVAGSPFRFVSPLIRLQFMQDSSSVDLAASLTYVYFNMNHIERTAWDRGRASIYYRTPSGSAWTNCSSTFFVSGENPPYGRLACIAPQSATFGLGILELQADLVPGAQVGPGVATASFVTETTAQTGNQGIFVPTGLDSDRIAVRLVDPGLESIPRMDFAVRRSIVRIDWIGDEQPLILTQGQDPGAETASTDEPATTTSLMYVFYVLDNVSRRMWDDGSLSIYYYDQVEAAWKVCPSVLAVQGEYGTVSCLASQFTYYALGIAQPDLSGVEASE